MRIPDAGRPDGGRADDWDSGGGQIWLAVGDPAARALEHGGRDAPEANAGTAILRVADVHSALAALAETVVDGCLVSAGLLDTRPRAALRSLRERLRAAPLWVVPGEGTRAARAAAEDVGVAMWDLGTAEPDRAEPVHEPDVTAVEEDDAPLPRADAAPPPADAVDPGKFAEGCLERIGRMGSLVRFILRTLTEASNAGRISLMLRDAERETLRLRAGRGINEALLGKVSCSVGVGIAGRVAALGRPVSGHGSTGGPREYRASGFVVLPLGPARRCEGVVSITGLPQNSLPSPNVLKTWARLCRRGGLALGSTRQLQRARSLSTRDGLTGLPNRRAFERALRREIERARRTSTGLVVALLDVDHFKAFNDRYGHQAGDRVLGEVGRRLQSAFRETDLVARWGGEEFAALLPGLTGRESGEARTALERARRTVGGRPFQVGPGVAPLRVTISGGLAAFPTAGDDGETLVRAADAALYRAKERGRDRIEG